MSTWLYFGVKLLHILAMAVWLGGPPIAVFGLRRGLDRAAVERLLLITPVFIGAALITMASGVGLAFLYGVHMVPLRIWLGAALTPLLFVIGGLLVRPSLLGLQAHFSSGATSDPEPLVRRFFLAHRLEMGLRVAILTTMVLPF